MIEVDPSKAHRTAFKIIHGSNALNLSLSRGRWQWQCRKRLTPSVFNEFSFFFLLALQLSLWSYNCMKLRPLLLMGLALGWLLRKRWQHDDWLLLLLISYFEENLLYSAEAKGKCYAFVKYSLIGAPKKTLGWGSSVIDMSLMTFVSFENGHYVPSSDLDDQQCENCTP